MTYNIKTPEGTTAFYALSQRAAEKLGQVAADEFQARCSLLDGAGLTIRQFDPQ